MSLNFLLLSSFTKNTATGTDSLSIQKRYRALSLIYLNLLTLTLFILWRVSAYLFFPWTDDPFFTMGSPLVILSMLYLKKGEQEKSVAVYLACLHLVIFIWGTVCGISTGALITVNLMPSISFFITSSSTLHINEHHALLHSKLHSDN